MPYDFERVEQCLCMINLALEITKYSRYEGPAQITSHAHSAIFCVPLKRQSTHIAYFAWFSTTSNRTPI